MVNVGNCSIHGWYGVGKWWLCLSQLRLHHLPTFAAAASDRVIGATDVPSCHAQKRSCCDGRLGPFTWNAGYIDNYIMHLLSWTLQATCRHTPAKSSRECFGCPKSKVFCRKIFGECCWKSTERSLISLLRLRFSTQERSAMSICLTCWKSQD